MAIRNDTILAGLNEERTKILDALNVDHAALKARLAAIEQVIAIYEPRVTESAKERLPKVLKAAKKIRSENENGNGHQPIGRTKKLTNKQRAAQLQQTLFQAVASRSQSTAEMTAIMLAATGNATSRGLGGYIAHGYMVRDKKGSYVLTPKGKHKLAELTGANDPSA